MHPSCFITENAGGDELLLLTFYTGSSYISQISHMATCDATLLMFLLKGLSLTTTSH